MSDETIAEPLPAAEPAPDETGAPAAASRGQQLVDRFLAVAKRIDGGARELETVRAWIDGPRAGAAPGPLAEPPTVKPKPTSFFEGMDMIATFLEEVADRQAKSVGGLKSLF